MNYKIKLITSESEAVKADDSNWKTIDSYKVNINGKISINVVQTLISKNSVLMGYSMVSVGKGTGKSYAFPIVGPNDSLLNDSQIDISEYWNQYHLLLGNSNTECSTKLVINEFSVFCYLKQMGRSNEIWMHYKFDDDDIRQLNKLNFAEFKFQNREVGQNTANFSVEKGSGTYKILDALMNKHYEAKNHSTSEGYQEVPIVVSEKNGEYIWDYYVYGKCSKREVANLLKHIPSKFNNAVEATSTVDITLLKLNRLNQILFLCELS